MLPEYKYLSFYDAYIENNEMWVSNLAFNGLFKVNLDTYEVNYVGSFKGEDVWQENLHRRVIRYKDVLFFIPYSGKGICTYNLITKEMGFIPIDSENNIIRVADAILDGNFLWMFPGIAGQPLLILNMDTLEVVKKPEWNEKAMACMHENADLVFDISNVCRVGRKIWLAPCDISKILEFNMDTNNFQVHTIDDNYIMKSISYDGNNFWLTFANSKDVLSWEPVSKNIMVYREGSVTEKANCPYMNVIFNNDDVLVLPSSEEYIMKADKKTGSLIPINSYPQGFKRIRNYTLFKGYTKKDGKILLYPRSGNQMLVMDCNTYEMTGNELIAPEQFDGTFYHNLLQDKIKNEMEKGIIFESKDASNSLPNFLDALSSYNKKRDYKVIPNSGKRIMENIINSIS